METNGGETGAKISEESANHRSHSDELQEINLIDGARNLSNDDCDLDLWLAWQQKVSDVRAEFRTIGTWILGLLVALIGVALETQIKGVDLPLLSLRSESVWSAVALSLLALVFPVYGYRALSNRRDLIRKNWLAVDILWRNEPLTGLEEFKPLMKE